MTIKGGTTGKVHCFYAPVNVCVQLASVNEIY